MGSILERRKPLRTALILALIVIMALSMAGCMSSSNDDSNSAAMNTAGDSGSDSSALEGAVPSAKGDSSEPSEGEESPASAGSDTKSSDFVSSDSASSDSASSDSASSDSASPDTDIIEPAEEPDLRQIQSGMLTAGEWSDLNDWEWWLSLMNNREWSAYQDRWGFTTYQRVTVRVESNGSPIIDAKVTLSGQSQSVEWKARTNNKGEAELFVNLFDKKEDSPYEITVQTEQEKKTIRNISVNPDKPITVELQSAIDPSDVVDIMFVVDTTGSMSDELDYLAAELKDVIRRVKNSHENDLRVRISPNFYRDERDDYVVRPFGFTENVDKAVEQISQQSAAGGGDYEEAVEEALDNAIHDHKWSGEARARLLFLVLDAPPHETDRIVGKLQKLAADAAEQGIRIIPVASSGVDKNTEFLMRFLNIVTGGTYVFLTDDSGIGNSHIEPTVGQYEVEQLNDLLVRVVNEYLQ
jgi:hypothetical protein